MGLVRPSSGKVKVLGREPSLDPSEDRLKISYISERVNPPMDWSVREFLNFNRHFYPHYNVEKEKELLKDFRISADARIGLLSAGEIRRVQVIAGLSSHPEVLLIDEITAVLDIVGRAKFNGILQQLRQQNPLITIIMATNILDDIDTYASHVLLLNQGKLKFYERKEVLLSTHSRQSLTQILAHKIEEDLGQ